MRWVHSPASRPASSTQLAAGDLLGVLAVDVAQPGRQLDEATLRGVAVLPQAEHPVLLVDREHDDRPGVLQHQPGEAALALRRARARGSCPTRSAITQSSRCRSRVATTGQDSGWSARWARSAVDMP